MADRELAEQAILAILIRLLGRLELALGEGLPEINTDDLRAELRRELDLAGERRN